MGVVDDLRQSATDTLNNLRERRDKLKNEIDQIQQDISDLVVFINVEPVEGISGGPAPVEAAPVEEKTEVSLGAVRDWAQRQIIPFMVKDCARAFGTTDAIVRIHLERLISMGTIRSTDSNKKSWVYYQFVKPRLQMAS